MSNPLSRSNSIDDLVSAADVAVGRAGELPFPTHECGGELCRATSDGVPLYYELASVCAAHATLR